MNFNKLLYCLFSENHYCYISFCLKPEKVWVPQELDKKLSIKLFKIILCVRFLHQINLKIGFYLIFHKMFIELCYRNIVFKKRSIPNVHTISRSPVIWKNLVHLFFVNLRKQGKTVLLWRLVTNYETIFFSVVLISNMKAFFKTFVFLTLPDLTR